TSPSTKAAWLTQMYALMPEGNGKSSRLRISQAIASMSSLSLGLSPSDGVAGASNRMSYCRYGAKRLEQAVASITESARAIRQQLLIQASIPSRVAGGSACCYIARYHEALRGRSPAADRATPPWSLSRAGFTVRAA